MSDLFGLEASEPGATRAGGVAESATLVVNDKHTIAFVAMGKRLTREQLRRADVTKLQQRLADDPHPEVPRVNVFARIWIERRVVHARECIPEPRAQARRGDVRRSEEHAALPELIGGKNGPHIHAFRGGGGDELQTRAVPAILTPLRGDDRSPGGRVVRFGPSARTGSR